MVEDDHAELWVIVVDHIKNVSFFVLNYLLRINERTGELDGVEVLVHLQVIHGNSVVSHRWSGQDNNPFIIVANDNTYGI